MEYYLVFDLGTTRIKAFAYSEDGKIIKSVSRNTKVFFPEPGWVEEDPLQFAEAVLNAGKVVVDELGTPKAVALTNQRSSTVIWDRRTGDPLCNLITWQDTRTAELAAEYTERGTFKVARTLGKLTSGLAKLIPPLRRARAIKYLISLANFRFGTNQPVMHIRWLMDNVEEVRKAIEQRRAMFGTIDSWIAYKLTGEHITDVTNATATGMFDPFYLKWSDRLMKTVGIPKHILPKIVDNMGPYGIVKELGGSPLAAMVADQQSSLYSAGGPTKGTVKMTHGTGTFIDVNIGTSPMPMRMGVYPMVAFKKGDEVYFLLEGIVQAMGSAIDWLVDVGVLPSVEKASELAESVEDSGGVIFFPALAGLGTPYWNPKARGLIYGLTRASGRGHLVRAMLEGLAMRVAEVLEILSKVSEIRFESVISDGGASKADFLLQSIADFSGVRVRRPKNLEGTSRGAFLLARGAVKGLSLREAWIPPEIEREFEPRRRSLPGWEEAKEFSLRVASSSL